MRRILATTLAAGTLVAGGARAEQGIDAQIFKPALDGNGIFSVERARGLARHDVNLRITTSYGQSPLKLDTLPGADGSPSGDVKAVLDYQLALNFGFSLGVSDRLTFAFDVPLQLQPLGEGYGVDGRYTPVNPNSPQAQPGTGFFSTREEQNTEPSENIPGDVRVGLKYRLTRGKLGVAVQGVVHVPFGDEDVFAGSAGFTFEPKLVLDLPFAGDKGVIAVNAGARIRDGAVAETRRVNGMGEVLTGPDGVVDDSDYFPRLYVGTEAVVAVGALYNVSDRLALGGEAYALVPIAKAPESMRCEGTCRNGDLTADVLLGAFIGVNPDLRVSIGAGAGVISDAARRDSFRVLASVSWAPSPAGARVIGRGDSDGDGIPDGPDVCPEEPEDGDGFQDDDGCPELDNDLDGILDAQDKCPNEPEDRDSFDDGDGCPEGDNDRDAVPDLTDRCPGEAEDTDGFQDDDGCPDEDNDGDGILDRDDKCPNEPETVNGYQDLDGCPDQGVQGGPKLTSDRIDLQGERIEFVGRTANLTKASQSTLDAVAQIMVQNWGARRVRFRIEVGVEASGTTVRTKQADRRLSEDRAEAVRQYLLSKGVDPAQIDVQGLGSEFPLDPANPRDPKNRRVEFIRLTQ